MQTLVCHDLDLSPEQVWQTAVIVLLKERERDWNGEPEYSCWL